jgi:hypothetical protein
MASIKLVVEVLLLLILELDFLVYPVSDCLGQGSSVLLLLSAGGDADIFRL